MRRIAALGLALTVAAALALLAGGIAQGSDSYRFDVIFDDAHGLVSGQEVKIAGAEAGLISNVVVTPNDKARVEATISGPFAFHTNATCIIRPDGLIAENYLDCDPGTASAPLLRGVGGYPPTVPVTHTSEPVTLQDLFNIFNLPTRERLQVFIDELGISTAGNGNEINAILQRANPALGAAQRVIGILDHQTASIATAIDATDQLAREGATHTAAVQAFLRQTAGLTRLTADHQSQLNQAINRLPAFLSASTPALAQLNTVATDGTPLLSELHAAVPALNRLDSHIVPFTALARPALSSLATALLKTIPTARRVTPLLGAISHYLKVSAGTTASFAKLTVNLIQHGFSESFLSVLYYVAGSLSKYDSDSHLLSTLLIYPGSGACSNYATTPSTNPACDAHYANQAAVTPARVGHHAPTSTPTRAQTNGAVASHVGVSGAAASLLSGVEATVGRLDSGISHSLGLGTATGTSATPSHTPTTGSLKGLLGYLLK
ncbi:MlaD family protein [Conexibacter sp. DBS9H8]|uniref:MlaD family protein n=1 Tax=Conexibacter sp. DBS9H8 TaxID=2937801 RepID=UPI00200BB285|nr:MlaD family protein [Conexibacter sp. DBS9H8]